MKKVIKASEYLEKEGKRITANMKTRKHNHEEIRIGCLECWKDNEPQHTPTPWNMKPGSWVIRGVDKIGVCELQRTGYPEQAAKNAAFIVRAVNSHEDLLYCLKQMSEIYLDKIGSIPDEVKEAIAKAEGK